MNIDRTADPSSNTSHSGRDDTATNSSRRPSTTGGRGETKSVGREEIRRERAENNFPDSPVGASRKRPDGENNRPRAFSVEWNTARTG